MPVYEVFTTAFHALDMMWLDIHGLDDNSMQWRYHQYWSGVPSRDVFQGSGGVPRPPLYEILMPLPVRIGQIVATIELRTSGDT
ncbi:hypothetical protein [Variovorax sp. LjRoot175]|uniref:hypothetical protein n=1 Tax=Variovorax sp. LjRoot175 TaxID=3342276 RepID=UPI003F510ACD